MCSGHGKGNIARINDFWSSAAPYSQTRRDECLRVTNTPKINHMELRKRRENQPLYYDSIKLMILIINCNTLILKRRLNKNCI